MTNGSESTACVRSALFIDFDNIYINLRHQDPGMADSFASDPATWLSWLENKMPLGHLPPTFGRRRILVRRCYLNPAMFQNYRPYLIRAGIEVVDCPALTAQGKTSSDIHMVMDILEALAHPTRFSEFFILSGDADFAPVLLKLREHDRYSVVLSVGYVSPAYKASCDYLITREEFIQQALGILLADDETAENEAEVRHEPVRPMERTLLARMAERLHEKAINPRGVEASDLPAVYREFAEFRSSTSWLGYFSLRSLTEALVQTRRDLIIVEEDPWRVARVEFAKEREPLPGQPEPVAPENGAKRDELLQAIGAWVRDAVSQSPGPVSMAALAQAMRREFGDYVAEPDWLGFTYFKSLVYALDLGSLQVALVGPGYLWDPTKHPQPGASDDRLVGALPIGLDALSRDHPDLAPIAMKVHQLTDMPYLSPEHYALILREIAREINENQSYHITRTSKKVRDRCVERGAPVARSHVNFVLLGIDHAGHDLGVSLPEDPWDIGQHLVQNTMNLCRGAQFIPSDQECELIQEWLTGKLERPIAALVA